MVNNQQEKKEAASRLASGNPSIITDTLLYCTYNFSDWQWVQNQCLQLLNNPNEDVRGLAATCLGHLARIHFTIEVEKVVPLLKELINRVDSVAGRAEDALDDIKIFVNIN